jgi:hypothetical protein
LDEFSLYHSAKNILKNQFLSFCSPKINYIHIFYFVKSFSIFSENSTGISPNVKVVYDVFGVAIKELRSGSSNPKNVAEQNTTKGAARLVFCVARAALAAKRIQSC